VNGRHLTIGSVETADVYYQGRTWITYVGHLPPGALTHGPNTITEQVLGKLGVLGPIGGSGVYRLVGSQDIDGQPAFELQTRIAKSALAFAAATALKSEAADRFDVWISKVTPLCRQLRRHAGGIGPQASQTRPGLRA
jgi:hypothetical protein